MRLNLRFVVKNTKQIGINQTYQDSSSRTSVLRKNATNKTITDKKENPLMEKNHVDKNLLHHKVYSLRSSGGIPKVSQVSRFSRLTL